MNLLTKRKGELILLLASILWGTCFAFQKMGMDYVGPFTFGFFRFGIGSLALAPVIFFLQKRKPQINSEKNPKLLYLGGFFCGLALFIAASLQQIGLQYTSSGKAGFITSLSIVFVAVFVLIQTKILQLPVVISVVLAMFGITLLCGGELFSGAGVSLEKGDLFQLAAIVFWAIQILCIDHFSKQVDVLKLSLYQFMVCGLLSFFCMLLFETPTLPSILAGFVPILYTGIIEVAIAYTLQVIGQKYTPPFTASILLSMEGVFSVFAGAFLLKEVMNLQELLGCILMFLAIFISQLPQKKLPIAVMEEI